MPGALTASLPPSPLRVQFIQLQQVVRGFERLTLIEQACRARGLLEQQLAFMSLLVEAIDTLEGKLNEQRTG